jgi:hypothetical protein
MGQSNFHKLSDGLNDPLVRMIGSGRPIEAEVFLSVFPGAVHSWSFSIGHNIVTVIQDIAKACLKGRELFGKFSESRGRLQTASQLVDEALSPPVISISKMRREWGAISRSSERGGQVAPNRATS